MTDQPSPSRLRRVAILIFDDIEVLDFAGPFEVFNVAGEVNDPPPFETYTVALEDRPIRARGQLQIIPHYTLDNCPKPDIAIIPGGFGTRALMDNARLMDWIRQQAEEAEYLLSVCTGALLLARAGLLDGLNATTHHTAFDRLEKEAPTCHIIREARYVDNGKIITSGGISAGIDMSLYVLGRLVPVEAYDNTISEMEYGWDYPAVTYHPAQVDSTAKKCVAYLTYHEMPDGTDDDHLPVELLREQGIEIEWVVWDDPAVDWGRYDAVIVRSPWDYYVRIEEFRGWLDKIEAMNVPVVNSIPLIRWNMDKFYLRELAEAGVPVLPAVWLHPGEHQDLKALMETQGWDEIVIKPTVSAGGFRTQRVTRENVAEQQALLDEILTDNGAMIQQYAPQVAQEGEWSLLFFDGEYSHSALKHPQSGDFRVQERYGGTFEPAQAPAHVIEQARALIRKIDRPMLYARVDGVVADGKLYLMELEAFEPSLFLAAAPEEAPANFTQALLRWLERIERV